MTLDEFTKALESASPEEAAAMAYTSPAVHFASCVTILDKRNQIIRPRPNILQLRMSEAYEVCMHLGVPCYMIVLKPRQVGCSTFGAHIVYHHGMRWRTNGLTISDKGDSSRKLMMKVRDYGPTDRFPWGVTQCRDTATNLEWTNGTRWEIDSAENWKAGIGDTRQAYHASEVPKWPKTGTKNDKRVMSAVLPSVAKGGRSVVIAEGTPEGAVGWFYETWQEAVTLEEFVKQREHGTDQGIVWIKVFAAWFEFAEYRREITGREQKDIEHTLTKREEELRKHDGVTWEQLAWRRDILRTECGGDEDTFEEYYPSDPVRCFAVSGRPRFNMQALMIMESRAKQLPPDTGHLVTQEDGRVIWCPRVDGQGDILVWEHPREGCRYLVGCDPATGASQTTVKDPDRSSVQVWRQGYFDPQSNTEHKARLVARVRSPYYGDADEVAGHLVRLSRYFGNCLIVPEVNMGLQVLEHLRLAGAPIYKRMVPSARIGTLVEQWGYKLKDVEQRRMCVEALAAAIREMNIDVACPDWIREAKAFVTSPNGRDEARPGEHDDDILAGAMCWYTMPAATEYRRTIRERRRPRDWNNWKRVNV